MRQAVRYQLLTVSNLADFRSDALSFFIFTLNKTSASEQNVCKIANSRMLLSRENHLSSLTLTGCINKDQLSSSPLYREASWATGHLCLATQGMKGEQSQWTVTHCGCAGREDGYLTGERAFNNTSNTSRIRKYCMTFKTAEWYGISAGYSIGVSQSPSTLNSLLLFSRLVYGNFPDYPAKSCLDIRDNRSSTPPSGAYYINITDPCTGESNITKVGTQYMIQLCLELNILNTWQVQ